MKNIIDVIAKPNVQLEDIYKELERLVDKTIGIKLFTLMETDHTRNVAWRSYTSMPDVYPTKGEKPRPNNKWSDIIYKKHETFVTNSIEGIAEVFPDHACIQSLGCESCINIPIIINGKVVGTLNCLHEADHYTSERVADSEKLKPAGILTFLMAANIRNQGENYE